MKTARRRACTALCLLAGLGPPSATTGQEDGPPPIPVGIPVLLVGDPRIDGTRLEPYAGAWRVFTLGKGASATDPASARSRGVSLQSLQRDELDGRPVWRRTVVRRSADGEELMSATVWLDVATLRPLRAAARQPDGTEIGFVYDWEDYAIRAIGSEEEAPPIVTLDLAMLEAAAHDVWMAALTYEDGFTARIPVIMASSGAKHWAVPRVVGTEPVELGDGRRLEAWVVSLDWWGMGGDSSYFPGVRPDGSVGSGGKYWILKDPPRGLGRVFRVRTEITPDADVVLEMGRGASQG